MIHNLRRVREVPGCRVWRSGQLLLATPRDLRGLAGHGISLVVDLRTPSTRARFPDRRGAGIAWREIDILAADDVPEGPQGADLMRARYARLVTSPAQRAALGAALRAVAEAPGGVLVHCTDGKDRTGWVAALLQWVAGDDVDTIRASYLASIPRVRGFQWLRYAADLVTRGPRRARAGLAINTVHPSYLDAGLVEVEARYGGLDRYLREGLGLGEETLLNLRSALGS